MSGISGPGRRARSNPGGGGAISNKPGSVTPPREGRGYHTVQNGPVGRQKAVLQSLLVVAGLERLLLRHDVVDVVAGEEGDLVATVPVEDTEEGEFGRVFLGGLGVVGQQVEHRRVRILHAYAPALHGRQAIEQPFVSAIC